MKSSSIKQMEIILYLNEREAKWLKDLMQNPLNETVYEESAHDSNMRNKFWQTLESEGV